MKNLQPDVKDLHGGMKIIHGSGEEASYRTEKDTSERKTTVNGVETTKSPVSQLPDIDQPTEKRDLIAADILESLGDRHSERFYRLIATKIPEDVIYEALSEIDADGAHDKARVFTFRMNRYAFERLRNRP